MYRIIYIVYPPFDNIYIYKIVKRALILKPSLENRIIIELNSCKLDMTYFCGG